MAYITQPNRTIQPKEGWVDLGEKPIIQMLFGDVLLLQSQTSPPAENDFNGKRLNDNKTITQYATYIEGANIYARALNQDAVVSVDIETP